jgi:hypothetical protein
MKRQFVFVILGLQLCTVLGSGCSDPHSPQFMNPHDGSSSGYRPASPSSVRIGEASERARTIMWHRNSSSEAGFVIERKAGSTGSYAILGLSPAGSTSFRDSSIITTDSIYFYRIHAYTTSGTAGSFDSASFVLPFAAPFDLHIAASSHDAIQFAWTDTGTFAEGYVLERRTGKSSFQPVHQLPAGSTTYKETQLDTTEDYAYRIRSSTSLNVSSASNTTGAVFTPVAAQPSTLASLSSGDGQGVIRQFVSDDGSLMMTMGVGTAFAVFQGPTGALVWKHDQNDIRTAAFSGDNATFVFSTADGNLHVIRLSDGQETRTIPLPPLNSGDGRVDVNYDGSLIAFTDNSSAFVYDARSGSKVMETPGHTAYISSIDFSPDGKTLACASGSSIELWDIAGGMLTSTLAGNGQQMFARFGPNGLMASISGGSLSFWDIKSHRLLSSTPSYWIEIGQGGFDAEGLRFVTEYQVNNLSPWQIGIWRVSDGVLLQSIPLIQWEAFSFWIGLTDAYSGHNSLISVDYGASVRMRRISYVWSPRDW